MSMPHITACHTLLAITIFIINYNEHTYSATQVSQIGSFAMQLTDVKVPSETSGCSTVLHAEFA